MEEVRRQTNKTQNGEFERTGKPGSGKYKGKDKLAMKKGLTEKQKAFADEYLRTYNGELGRGNATAAFRASKGTLDDKSLWLPSDRNNGQIMKNTEKIKEYLQQKIALEAEECLDLQMELIRDDRMPPAVRHDAIKDRLNRLGVGKDKESGGDYVGVGEVTITIKHKKPEILDSVDIIDGGSEDV